MRRTRYLLLLLAVLAFAGFSRPPASTLSVDGVYCNNGGGGYFYCYADVSGGSGSYSSYAWQYTEYRVTRTYYTNRATTYDPTLSDNCTVDRNVAISMTVTDSQGATATGSTDLYCSQWAD